jgi:prevent-host-death family protein
MATRMGIRELRDTLTQTLRRVQGGETIEVTHHGAPVALLAPLPEGRIERLVASGEVTRAAPLDRLPRRFRMIGEQGASEALEDDRAER